MINMDWYERSSKMNYTFSAAISKAPNFCAVDYLHNFKISRYRHEKNSYMEKFPAKTCEKAAVDFVSMAVKQVRGTYLRLCDNRGGLITEYLVAHLPKTFKVGKVLCTVDIGEWFQNRNSGNMVREVSILMQATSKAKTRA